MKRPTATPRFLARFRGPTTFSVLIHAVALILLVIFSTRAPIASEGDTALRALAIAPLDDVQEESDEPVEADPEIEFEEIEEPVEEMEVVLEAEPIEEPPLERLAMTPCLEPLECTDRDVPDLTLPSLAAVPPRPAPKPVPLVRPVLRPQVLAAGLPVARPVATPVVRRPVSRPRPASGRGRALRAIHKPLYYPPHARRLGIQGRARVQLSISASGQVTNVVLVQSSGSSELDQAALASARQWRFQPPGESRRIVTWMTFRFA